MENLKYPFEEHNFTFFSSFSSPLASRISERKNFIWRGSYKDALDFIRQCASFDSFKKCLHSILFEKSKENWSSVYLNILDFWSEKIFPKNRKFKDFDSAEEEIEFGVTKVLICNQVKSSIYIEMSNWDYPAVIFSALFFLFEEKQKNNAEKKIKEKNKDEKLLFYIVLENFFYQNVQDIFYYFFENTSFLKYDFSNLKTYTNSFLISKYQRETFYSLDFDWSEGNCNFLIPNKDKRSLTLILGCFSDIENVKKMIPGLVTNDPLELQVLLDFLKNCTSSQILTRFEKKIINLEKLIYEKERQYFSELSAQISDFISEKFDPKIDIYGGTLGDNLNNEIEILAQDKKLKYIAQWAYFLKCFDIQNFRELGLLEKQNLGESYFFQKLFALIENSSLEELENYLSRSFGKRNEENPIKRFLLSEELEEFARNNFFNRNSSEKEELKNNYSKKIVAFSILAFISIIAKLVSSGPYGSSGFKNIAPPPIKISADMPTTEVSLPSQIRGGANISKSKYSLNPCRNNYQRFPRCASHLQGELMRLRGDMESDKLRVLDRCPDQETRTKLAKFLDDKMTSVDNSINFSVILTPMQELQTSANTIDQCHVDKSPHGNVLAQNYKYTEEPHHMEKLQTTLERYSLDKNYPIKNRTQEEISSTLRGFQELPDSEQELTAEDQNKNTDSGSSDTGIFGWNQKNISAELPFHEEQSSNEGSESAQGPESTQGPAFPSVEENAKRENNS